ncbi:hypothetical protein A5634_10145 [Mycobacterium asiaticum]|uniref:PPE-PPW subfamily C-terminal domain-containing protein n=2 Tax=Mycobacterium asiaticum TaxID=1790 RepID=A0A1A3NJB6_MYCAS|nr:hypothetical protein A5634_10145 [Mycobacterium asiaticum]
MIFGADGARISGQGQPNWNPLQYLQNISNFLNGNQQALAYLQTNLPQLLTNPANFPALASYFVAWQTYRVVNWTLRTLRFLVQMAPLLLPAFLNAATTYLGGLAALAALAPPAAAAVPAAPIPLAPVSQLPPPAMLLAAPALAPTPAPLTPSSAAPAPPAPTVSAVSPPPAPGVEGFGYLVGGPGPGFGSTMGARIATPQTAADSAGTTAAASAASRDQVRAARRQRTTIARGHRYEYLDADDAADSTAPMAAAAVSEPSSTGFAGTVGQASPRPAGLTALAGDEFGNGPRVPMLPETWVNPGKEQ